MAKNTSQKTPQRILVVTFVQLSKESGGPARLALGVAQALHAEGRLLGLVAPRIDPSCTDLPSSQLYSPPHPLFHRLFERWLAYRRKSSTADKRRVREFIFDFFLSRSKLLRKADAIVFLKPAFPETASKAKQQGTPTFVWASILNPEFNRDQVLAERAKWNSDGGEAYVDDRRIQRLNRFFSQTGHILVASEVAYASYANAEGTRDSVSLIEGNFAVDLDGFVPASKSTSNVPFRAMHISQMNVIKGIGYLLAAWSEAQLSTSELLLVGSMEPDVARLCREMNLPSVREVGFAPDVSVYLSQADVLISPSVADLHPYTVLEAMASGVPVIVSDRCGISAAIDHGVNGWIYPYQETKTLANHLRWCEANPSALQEMGLAAREKALQFNYARFAENLIQKIDQHSN